MNVPLPQYVQLEPVGQCNLRCQMCPVQFRTDGTPNGPPAFMDFAAFTVLIDQFSTLRELHLQGLGEPMMHPRFFDMVEYAVARGIRVTTNSNLTLLSRRRAERCVTSGLDCLHVSLDAASPAAFEAIRVGASFERVVGNLRLFAETRAHLHADRPRLHLVTVVMRRNLAELPALVELAHAHGAEELFVQHLCHDFGETSLPAHYRPMRDFVDAETLLGADREQIEATFTAARDRARRLGLRLRLPRPRPRAYPPGTPGRERCNWPWSGAYISYDGQAMPCCMVATPDRYNFGNMAAQGVAPIWDSAHYQEFRARLDSDEPPEICRSCALYNGTF